MLQGFIVSRQYSFSEIERFVIKEDTDSDGNSMFEIEFKSDKNSCSISSKSTAFLE